MTDIYSTRLHSDIPKRVRDRIIANIEAAMDTNWNVDGEHDMLEDFIDIAYLSYHAGWQAGYIDDTQEPDMDNFNPGGTK